MPQPEALPPHDIASEEAILAALMIDGSCLTAVTGIVSPEDFFREHNGWVLEAAQDLAQRGDEITPWTLCHELDRRERLDAVGGETYLTDILGKYFTAIGVEAHARIVARDSVYRRLIAAAGQIAQLAYEGGPDVERVVNHAIALVTTVYTPAETEQIGAMPL